MTKLHFIHMRRSPNATCTGVWMGSNTIRGYTWNWNNDPNFLSIPLGNLTPEKCLRLKKDTLDAAYISCNSDLSDVRGAVCFRNATGLDFIFFLFLSLLIVKTDFLIKMKI